MKKYNVKMMMLDALTDIESAEENGEVGDYRPQLAHVKRELVNLLRVVLSTDRPSDLRKAVAHLPTAEDRIYADDVREAADARWFERMRQLEAIADAYAAERDRETKAKR